MRRAALRPVAALRQATPGLDANAILAALPVAVAVLDSADRFVFVNPAGEQFFTASRAQLSRLALSDFVAAGDPLTALVRRVRSEGATIAAHGLALESPRLTRRRVDVEVGPLAELPGAILLGLSMAPAAGGFDRGAEAAAGSRGLAGIAAVLAHEVKNPLSGIRGAAQLLEATLTGGERELAVLVREEADRIRALIERMEMLGPRPLERRPVNIHRVLEHVRRLAKNGFAASIRMSEAYDPSLPPCLGDRDQLVQVLLNLVKNAAEAITRGGIAGGEIALSTAFQPGVFVPGEAGGERRHLPLIVSVRDNGPGIAAELQPLLFEPFVSGKAGGGLGLALVRKIVTEHGGLTEVESRPGRTEFRLRLPVAPEEWPAVARPGDEESGL